VSCWWIITCVVGLAHHQVTLRRACPPGVCAEAAQQAAGAQEACFAVLAQHCWASKRGPQRISVLEGCGNQAVGRAKEGLDGTKGTCRDWSASEATQHARRTALKSLNASGRGRESCTHLASQTWTGRQGGRTAPDFSLTVNTGFGWCVSRYVHCLLDCMCELVARCSWLLRKLSAEKPASTF